MPFIGQHKKNIHDTVILTSQWFCAVEIEKLVEQVGLQTYIFLKSLASWMQKHDLLRSSKCLDFATNEKKKNVALLTCNSSESEFCGESVESFVIWGNFLHHRNFYINSENSSNLISKISFIKNVVFKLKIQKKWSNNKFSTNLHNSLPSFSNWTTKDCFHFSSQWFQIILSSFALNWLNKKEFQFAHCLNKTIFLFLFDSKNLENWRNNENNGNCITIEK